MLTLGSNNPIEQLLDLSPKDEVEELLVVTPKSAMEQLLDFSDISGFSSEEDSNENLEASFFEGSKKASEANSTSSEQNRNKRVLLFYNSVNKVDRHSYFDVKSRILELRQIETPQCEFDNSDKEIKAVSRKYGTNIPNNDYTLEPEVNILAKAIFEQHEIKGFSGEIPTIVQDNRPPVSSRFSSNTHEKDVFMTNLLDINSTEELQSKETVFDMLIKNNPAFRMKENNDLKLSNQIQNLTTRKLHFPVERRTRKMYSGLGKTVKLNSSKINNKLPTLNEIDFNFPDGDHIHKVKTSLVSNVIKTPIETPVTNPTPIPKIVYIPKDVCQNITSIQYTSNLIDSEYRDKSQKVVKCNPSRNLGNQSIVIKMPAKQSTTQNINTPSSNRPRRRVNSAPLPTSLNKRTVDTKSNKIKTLNGKENETVNPIIAKKSYENNYYTIKFSDCPKYVASKSHELPNRHSLLMKNITKPNTVHHDQKSTKSKSGKDSSEEYSKIMSELKSYTINKTKINDRIEYKPSQRNRAQSVQLEKLKQRREMLNLDIKKSSKHSLIDESKNDRMSINKKMIIKTTNLPQNHVTQTTKKVDHIIRSAFLPRENSICKPDNTENCRIDRLKCIRRTSSLDRSCSKNTNICDFQNLNDQKTKTQFNEIPQANMKRRSRSQIVPPSFNLKEELNHLVNSTQNELRKIFKPKEDEICFHNKRSRSLSNSKSNKCVIACNEKFIQKRSHSQIIDNEKMNHILVPKSKPTEAARSFQSNDRQSKDESSDIFQKTFEKTCMHIFRKRSSSEGAIAKTSNAGKEKSKPIVENSIPCFKTVRSSRDNTKKSYMTTNMTKDIILKNDDTHKSISELSHSRKVQSSMEKKGKFNIDTNIMKKKESKYIDSKQIIISKSHSNYSFSRNSDFNENKNDRQINTVAKSRQSDSRPYSQTIQMNNEKTRNGIIYNVTKEVNPETVNLEKNKDGDHIISISKTKHSGSVPCIKDNYVIKNPIPKNVETTANFLDLHKNQCQQEINPITKISHGDSLKVNKNDSKNSNFFVKGIFKGNEKSLKFNENIKYDGCEAHILNTVEKINDSKEKTEVVTDNYATCSSFTNEIDYVKSLAIDNKNAKKKLIDCKERLYNLPVCNKGDQSYVQQENSKTKPNVKARSHSESSGNKSYSLQKENTGLNTKIRPTSTKPKLLFSSFKNEINSEEIPIKKETMDDTLVKSTSNHIDNNTDIKFKQSTKNNPKLSNLIKIKQKLTKTNQSDSTVTDIRQKIKKKQRFTIKKCPEKMNSFQPNSDDVMLSISSHNSSSKTSQSIEMSKNKNSNKLFDVVNNSAKGAECGDRPSTKLNNRTKSTLHNIGAYGEKRKEMITLVDKIDHLTEMNSITMKELFSDNNKINKEAMEHLNEHKSNVMFCTKQSVKNTTKHLVENYIQNNEVNPTTDINFSEMDEKVLEHRNDTSKIKDSECTKMGTRHTKVIQKRFNIPQRKLLYDEIQNAPQNEILQSSENKNNLSTTYYSSDSLVEDSTKEISNSEKVTSESLEANVKHTPNLSDCLSITSSTLEGSDTLTASNLDALIEASLIAENKFLRNYTYTWAMKRLVMECQKKFKYPKVKKQSTENIFIEKDNISSSSQTISNLSSAGSQITLISANEINLTINDNENHLKAGNSYVNCIDPSISRFTRFTSNFSHIVGINK